MFEMIVNLLKNAVESIGFSQQMRKSLMSALSPITGEEVVEIEPYEETWEQPQPSPNPYEEPWEQPQPMPNPYVSEADNRPNEDYSVESEIEDVYQPKPIREATEYFDNASGKKYVVAGEDYAFSSPDGEKMFVLDKNSRIAINVQDAYDRGWISEEPIDTIEPEESTFMPSIMSSYSEGEINGFSYVTTTVEAVEESEDVYKEVYVEFGKMEGWDISHQNLSAFASEETDELAKSIYMDYESTEAFGKREEKCYFEIDEYTYAEDVNQTLTVEMERTQFYDYDLFDTILDITYEVEKDDVSTALYFHLEQNPYYQEMELKMGINEQEFVISSTRKEV